MNSFPSDDPIWDILAAIDDEPTGEFSELVKAARLDPKVDFRDAFLVKLSLKGADISGFDFSGSDLRGTGLRLAAKSQGVIISETTRLDPADQRWWDRERAKLEKLVKAAERVGQRERGGAGLGGTVATGWARVPYQGDTMRGGVLALPNVGAVAGHRAVAGSPFHSRAEAANAVRTADLLVLTFLFLIMIGGYHVHAMLTMGDWDFWVDWKDRRMWPRDGRVDVIVVYKVDRLNALACRFHQARRAVRRA